MTHSAGVELLLHTLPLVLAHDSKQLLHPQHNHRLSATLLPTASSAIRNTNDRGVAFVHKHTVYCTTLTNVYIVFLSEPHTHRTSSKAMYVVQ